MKKIFWSPLAYERLEEIFEFISEDNVSAAQATVKKIIKKVETLSKNEQRGRIVPEANRNEVREIFEGEYRIIYRIEPKTIHILSIRNFKQQLLPKDIK